VSLPSCFSRCFSVQEFSFLLGRFCPLLLNEPERQTGDSGRIPASLFFHAVRVTPAALLIFFPQFIFSFSFRTPRAVAIFFFDFSQFDLLICGVVGRGLPYFFFPRPVGPSLFFHPIFFVVS